MSQFLLKPDVICISYKNVIKYDIRKYFLWSPYVIGQTIIFLPCGFYLLLSFFFSSPNLSGRILDVVGTIAQLRRAIFSQLRHVSTIGKEMLSSNTSSTCPYNMVNFGPLVAEIISLVFFWLSMCPLVTKIYPDKVVRWFLDGEFLAIFWDLHFKRAACSTFSDLHCKFA